MSKFRVYLIRCFSERSEVVREVAADIKQGPYFAMNLVVKALRNTFEAVDTTVDIKHLDNDPHPRFIFRVAIQSPGMGDILKLWHDTASRKHVNPTLINWGDETCALSILELDEESDALIAAYMLEDVYPSNPLHADGYAHFEMVYNQTIPIQSASIQKFAQQLLSNATIVVNQERKSLDQIVAQAMKPPVGWAAIEQRLSHYDYPGEEIAQHGGIPQDTAYQFVSSSFLNGLVNYAGIKQAFLVNRYGVDRRGDDDYDGDTDWNEIDSSLPMVDQYQLRAAQLGSNPHLSKIGTIHSDDVFLFGETPSDYWVFYYDCDCSDCDVARLSKESFPDLTYEILVKSRLDRWIEIRKDENPIVVEIAPEKKGNFGWISG